MKSRSLLIYLVAALLTPMPALMAAGKASAAGAEAPSKWGPGCNNALLEGEFSLAKAPEIPCSGEQKIFIEWVIGQMNAGNGSTMVLEDSPHPWMDTPEFTSLFLRAFADPGDSLGTYDYRCERLMGRLSRHMAMLEDPRLDWDMWRAWLLIENKALTSDYYESAEVIDGSRMMNSLDSAREVLWNYIGHNAAAILKDEKRRAWWIRELSRDLHADGGRPMRRWFLLALLAAADPERRALEKIPMKEVMTDGSGRKVPLRQPHPLDPFIIVTDTEAPVPSFADALAGMAAENDLSLEVLGLEPAEQPATLVHQVRLEMTKWPVLETPVINQESWSKTDGQSSGDEWGVRFYRPVGRREGFSSVSFPEDRRSGVYFCVFNRRLCVWPKEKMDAAVIQMLHTAHLLSDTELSEIRKRGFAPLKTTLIREREAK